jgi:hypothetical protein
MNKQQHVNVHMLMIMFTTYFVAELCYFTQVCLHEILISNTFCFRLFLESTIIINLVRTKLVYEENKNLFTRGHIGAFVSLSDCARTCGIVHLTLFETTPSIRVKEFCLCKFFKVNYSCC